ncbi:MAG: lytic murein transglycosylase B [Gammaproteobacteria bacterium]|nr:MAG: lytic murein transglycosylase B [Gammaproteobacteria bacterium]
MIRYLLLLLFWLGSAISAEPANPSDPSPEVLQEVFIQEMVTQHGFRAEELRTLLASAKVKESILETIARPAEKRLTWGEYRRIFLTRERVKGGLRYWQANRLALQRAEKTYGVPAHIIVAIIGVETRYGRHAGRYRVLDALTTLGFHYPPRAAFFRRELGEFLLLSREEQSNPLALLGSYAGAMGKPQFIPSSFRAYAVDFDGDGRRDIWNNDADVIGSVANYFARHGWRPGEPVAQRVQVPNVTPALQAVIDRGYKPSSTVGELIDAGVILNTPLAPDLPAALLALEGESGTEYWLALPNFYVITRYNHSPLYAMAVYQLSDAIQRLIDHDAS